MVKRLTKKEFTWWQKEAYWFSEKYQTLLLHWPKGTGKTLFGTYMLKEYALKNPFSQCFGIFLGAFLAHFDSSVLSKLFENEQNLIATKGKNYLKLTNGSEIRLITSSIESIRSHNVDFAFLDEYMFFKKDFMNNFIPQLTKKSKILVTATPGKGAPSAGVKFHKSFILNVPDGTVKQF